MNINEHHLFLLMNDTIFVMLPISCCAIQQIRRKLQWSDCASYC